MVDPSKVIEKMKHNKEVSKEYYDRGARQLSELNPSDTVRMQVQDEWIPCTVVRQANAPRLYVVNGPEYRRNRKHLRRVNEPPLTTIDVEDVEPPPQLPSVEQPNGTMTTAMSKGRIVRTPSRYKDFVRHS